MHFPIHLQFVPFEERYLPAPRDYYLVRSDWKPRAGRVKRRGGEMTKALACEVGSCNPV